MNYQRAILVVALLACGSAHATHAVQPLNLVQQAPLGTNLPPGARIAVGGTVNITASSDAETFGSSSLYQLEIELRPVGTAFSNTPTHMGGQLINKADLGFDQPYPMTAITGLAPGSYKWQVRERQGTSTSPWVQFNAGLAAFQVVAVTVTPSTTNFNVVRVGQTSAPTPVEVVNDTQGPVTLTAASISSGAPFTIVSGPQLPTTLAAGGRVTFTVTASPTAVGPATGTFTVVSDQPSSPHTGTLTVTGGGPQLTVAQPTVNFGETGINGAGITRNITVNNTGNLPLAISGATTTAPFSVSAGTTQATVAPGQSHTFVVTYAPTALGNHAGTLSITSDSSGSPHTVQLQGTGIDPHLQLDRTAINFPDVDINNSSAPVTVTLSNSGNGNLAVGAPTVTGPFTTTLTARSVAQGSNTTFTVTFSPTTPGPKTGTLTIPSNDAATPATITLNGLARAAGLAAAPSSHDFGTVALGVAQTSTFTLSNPGDTTLNVTSLTVTGANPTEFSVQGAPPAPFTLAAGASLPFSVAFAPTSTGIRSAQIQIVSNRFPAGTFSIPLSGTGHGAKIALNTSTLTFGFATVGSTTVRTFEVGNSGSTPLTVNGLTFNSGAAYDYATTQQLPFTVQPGTTTTVSISFTPTAVGVRNSVLTVASTDGLVASSDITLNGTGMSPDLVASPNALDFGTTRVGQSKLLGISIRNTGNGTLTISNATITGGDASQFTVSPVGSGVSIPANGPGHTINVTYNPTAVGAANSTLVLVSNDPDTPNVTIPLSGEGIAPGLALSATSLNFGGQLVRLPISRDVTLKNDGNAPMQVGKISVSGSGASSFAVAEPVGAFTLPAGGERKVTVVATPVSMGELSATLDITTDVPGAPVAHVDLVALGLSEILSLSQASLDFGVIRNGTTGKTMQFTVTNAASEPLALNAPSFTGGSALLFSAELSATSIPAQGTVTVTVGFKPTAAGAHTSDLILTSTDSRVPSIKLTVKGTSVSQTLEAAPASVSFGSVPVGEAREEKVMLTNKTTSVVTITGFTSSGSDFSVVTAPPIALQPGGQTEVTLSFAPTSPKPSQASLGVLLDGAAEDKPELNLSASGTGTASEESSGCSSTGGATPLWALLALALAVPAIRRRRMS